MSLYMNLSQYIEGISRLPRRWPVQKGDAAGYQEGEPVHESKPIHEGVQYSCHKEGPEHSVKVMWQAAKKGSQYMKRFSIAAIKKVQNIR
jgi:hypothetical protein